jgi:uncharacterized protein YbjQ (UPF0145 family)
MKNQGKSNNMASDHELERARELIKNKQYSDAERILKRLDDPTATAWLKKIHELQASEHQVLSSSSYPASITVNQPPKAKRDVDIIVTTADLPYPYRVISPVYFQVSNKGLFSTELGKLTKKYKDEIKEMKENGLMSKGGIDLGILWYGEWSIGQNQFESAFFVAIREMQKRAARLKADAVVGMRQDIDLDSNGFQFFYLQMYGTAVTFM